MLELGSSGPSLNDQRESWAGVRGHNSAIKFLVGMEITAETETWNGSWTEVNDLNTGTPRGNAAFSERFYTALLLLEEKLLNSKMLLNYGMGQVGLR